MQKDVGYGGIRVGELSLSACKGERGEERKSPLGVKLPLAAELWMPEIHSQRKNSAKEVTRKQGPGPVLQG